MIKSLLAALVSLVAVQSVAGHSIFQQLVINGVRQERHAGIRVPSYNGPITDVTSNDIICNGGINPYRQPVSKVVFPVPAGSTVGAQWHYMLNSNTGDNSDPIDPSHNGPVMAYLAKVPDATQENVTGLKWFKIYEDGLDANGWAVERLIKNNGLVNFKIPDCIEPGQYLLRVELIALHAAQTYPGAQFYMECAQINITGTGGNVSPATVSFPGAYKGTDPGVAYNLYNGQRTYTIPGPRPFTCDGSNPNPQPSNQPNPTTAPAPTTTSTTQPTQPTGPTVPQWGHCGGIGYSGSTTCTPPFRCVKTNDYYSQCLA